MRILGIDYGRAKMGIALGDTNSKLAEPLQILKYQDVKTLIPKIRNIIEKENIEKIVVGISEGQMGIESKTFGQNLQEELENVPVEFWDETLTSSDAKRLSIEAGIRRKKRRNLEDAYSAALILESWFTSLS